MVMRQGKKRLDVIKATSEDSYALGALVEASVQDINRIVGCEHTVNDERLGIMVARKHVRHCVFGLEYQRRLYFLGKRAALGPSNAMRGYFLFVALEKHGPREVLGPKEGALDKVKGRRSVSGKRQLDAFHQ
jgi:hypothetical protein